MKTTLTQRSLTNFVVKYTFAPDELRIIIEQTSGVHNIKGDVKITLANCLVVNATDSRTGQTMLDILNQTLFFKAINTTILEAIIRVKDGLDLTPTLTILPNNGSPITAFIDNLKVELEPLYKRKMTIDTQNSNFIGTDTEADNLNQVRFLTTINASGVIAQENESVSQILSQNNFVLDIAHPTTIELTNYTTSSNVFVLFQ